MQRLSQTMGLKNQKTTPNLTLTVTVVLSQQPVPNSGLALTVHSLFVMLKSLIQKILKERTFGFQLYVVVTDNSIEST